MRGAAIWLTAICVAALTHGVAIVGLARRTTPAASDAAEPVQSVYLAVNLVDPPAPLTPKPKELPLHQPVSRRAAVAESEISVPMPPPAVGGTDKESSSSPSPPVRSVYRKAALAPIPPRALDPPQPRYPVAARRKGLEGTVRCQVEVSAVGELVSVQLIESSGYKSLDRAAIRALEDTAFAPGEIAGRPVAGTLTVAVRFRIRPPLGR